MPLLNNQKKRAVRPCYFQLKHTYDVRFLKIETPSILALKQKGEQNNITVF